MNENPVNAYFIGTQNECSWTEVIDPEIGGPTYWEHFYDVVFAHSRGQARAIFCTYHDLEFTEPLNIELIRKDVGRVPRVAEGTDPIWYEVDAKHSQGSLPTDMLIPDTLQEDER